jgi:deoxyribodipyrimidine photo-lyase
MCAARGAAADTRIALFTRDLRLHDNPVLCAAAAGHRVVPVFVLDEGLLAGSFNRANRAAFLLDCLTDLRRSLGALGAPLVVRRGDTATEVARLAAEVQATEVHVARDVSAFAETRIKRLRRELAAHAGTLHVHDAVTTAVAPGALRPGDRDHFAVFTPYYRRWEQAPRRECLPAPSRLTRSAVPIGRLPLLSQICSGTASRNLPPGGETEGRRRMRVWLDTGVEGYAAGSDDLAADRTSRLSPYLHFGCISAGELLQGLGSTEPE